MHKSVARRRYESRQSASCPPSAQTSRRAVRGGRQGPGDAACQRRACGAAYLTRHVAAYMVASGHDLSSREDHHLRVFAMAQATRRPSLPSYVAV